MARRSDHTREELRDLILSSASNIIEKEGFSALTARKIAADIGYTPGTLYNVFQSMDGLTLVLNGMTLEKLLPVLANSKEANKDKAPEEIMKAMARAYRDFATTNRERWVIMFKHELSDKEEIPEWFRDKTALLFQPLESVLKDHFTFSSDKERQITARSLWAAIHGIYFLHETGKLPLLDGDDVCESMTDALIDNCVKGLRK